MFSLYSSFLFKSHTLPVHCRLRTKRIVTRTGWVNFFTLVYIRF